MARFRGGLEWHHFVRWCKTRGLRPLPSHPWTLAAYVRACERRFPKGAMPARLRSIARAHLLQGFPSPDRHPIVARTLRAVETRARNRHLGSDLFPADVTAATAPPAAPEAEADRRQDEADSPARRTLRQTPVLVSRRPRDT